MGLILSATEQQTTISNALAMAADLVFHPDVANMGTGVAASQQFILEDVERKVAEYGKDTAFFGTNQG